MLQTLRVRPVPCDVGIEFCDLCRAMLLVFFRLCLVSFFVQVVLVCAGCSRLRRLFSSAQVAPVCAGYSLLCRLFSCITCKEILIEPDHLSNPLKQIWTLRNTAFKLELSNFSFSSFWVRFFSFCILVLHALTCFEYRWMSSNFKVWRLLYKMHF